MNHKKHEKHENRQTVDTRHALYSYPKVSPRKPWQPQKTRKPKDFQNQRQGNTHNIKNKLKSQEA